MRELLAVWGLVGFTGIRELKATWGVGRVNSDERFVGKVGGG